MAKLGLFALCILSGFVTAIGFDIARGNAVEPWRGVVLMVISLAFGAAAVAWLLRRP